MTDSAKERKDTETVDIDDESLTMVRARDCAMMFTAVPKGRGVTMRLTNVIALLAMGACLALAGCGGDDGQGTGGADQGPSQPDEPGYFGPGVNDSDMDDGSGWPRWKNPCPGPACDPPRGTNPEWIVDPPPDKEAPATPAVNPAPLPAPVVQMHG